MELGYLARVEVIKLVNGDEMVWPIRKYTRINKYARKCRRSVQTHQDKLETTGWSVHVRADISLSS